MRQYCQMRGQLFQDVFEHFVRESRSGMPDVAQLALVVDAEHQRSKMFSRSRGFGNASDHGLLLHARLDLEPGFGASSRLLYGPRTIFVGSPDEVSDLDTFDVDGELRVRRRSSLNPLANQ